MFRAMLSTDLSFDNQNLGMEDRKVYYRTCLSSRLITRSVTGNALMYLSYRVILTYWEAPADVRNHSRRNHQTRRISYHIPAGVRYKPHTFLKPEAISRKPDTVSTRRWLTSRFLSCTNTLGAETKQMFVDAEEPSSSCFASVVAVSSLY